METYLDRILDSTRQRLAGSRRRRCLADLDRQARTLGSPRGFVEAMTAPGISLIAEVKRRSPSKGEIRAVIDPAQVAMAYERGGARAISVLTEPEFFSGSLDDLAAARAATTLPVLRKDFLLEPYQIAEARAAGADAILLIVAALPGRGHFAEMAAAAADYAMGALIEVHDEAELEQALEVNPQVLGVNQRDLRTFAVDKGLAVRLRAQVPAGVALVAESGIADRADVLALEAAGVDGMLVGETLMRSGDPSVAAAALLGR